MGLTKRKIQITLLYYSVVFATILLIGGFWQAKRASEIIANFLFLPIVIFLWMVLVQQKKEKNQKIKKDKKRQKKSKDKK